MLVHAPTHNRIYSRVTGAADPPTHTRARETQLLSAIDSSTKKITQNFDDRWHDGGNETMVKHVSKVPQVHVQSPPDALTKTYTSTSKDSGIHAHETRHKHK